MTHSLRRFVRDLARFSGPAGVRAAVYVALGALLEGVGLMLLVPLLAVVVSADGTSGVIGRLTQDHLWSAFGASSPGSRLAVLLAVFAVLMIVRAVVIWKRDVGLAELQTGYVRDIRVRLIRAVAAAPWTVVSRLRHGRVTHILGADLDACGNAVHFVFQTAIALLLLAVQVVLTVFLSPILSIVTLVFIAAGALIARPFLRSANDLGAMVSDANVTISHDTGQFLGGLKVAVAQNLGDGFIRKLERSLDLVTSRQVEFAGERTRAQLVLTALSAGIAGVALLLGAVVLDTPPVSMIAVLLVLARMAGPLTRIQQGAQYIIHSLPAFEKVRALEAELQLAPLAEQSSDTATPPIADRRVAFRDVSLVRSDPPARPALSHVCVDITAGCFLGIGGSSGAGKTSFVDLLVGLIPPSSGEVLIGGIPLSGSAVRPWQDCVSYVSQDPFLFHESIRENLLWARPDASEAEIWDALSLAGADAFARRLPDGLDTAAGERGTLISGGERQRIALARALIRRPLLLVLDEATNAIDVAGEHAILERLAALIPRPTIVMVAHRDQSLAQCERILHFDAGRLVGDTVMAAAPSDTR